MRYIVEILHQLELLICPRDCRSDIDMISFTRIRFILSEIEADFFSGLSESDLKTANHLVFSSRPGEMSICNLLVAVATKKGRLCDSLYREFVRVLIRLIARSPNLPNILEEGIHELGVRLCRICNLPSLQALGLALSTALFENSSLPNICGAFIARVCSLTKRSTGSTLTLRLACIRNLMAIYSRHGHTLTTSIILEIHMYLLQSVRIAVCKYPKMDISVAVTIVQAVHIFMDQFPQLEKDSLLCRETIAFSSLICATQFSHKRKSESIISGFLQNYT